MVCSSLDAVYLFDGVFEFGRVLVPRHDAIAAAVEQVQIVDEETHAAQLVQVHHPTTRASLRYFHACKLQMLSISRICSIP